jgi:hypothetical protein
MNGQVPGQRNVNVQIPDDRWDILYTDQVFLTTNPFGFTLDFGQQTPQANLVRVTARVAMSPEHMKALASLLQKQVEVYEKQYGTINVTPQMQERLEKGQSIGFQTKDKK